MKSPLHFLWPNFRFPPVAGWLLALMMIAGGGPVARAATATLQLQISGLGTVSLTATNGIVEGNYTNTALQTFSNAVLQIGTTYQVTATPATNFVFSNWVISTNWAGNLTSNASTLYFVMQSNLTLQASFLDTIPPTVTITAPTTTQVYSNAMFTALGTTSNRFATVGVWYSLNAGAWTLASTTNNWTNWSAALTSTPNFNILQAYAEDPNGNFSATNYVSYIYANGSAVKLITFDDLPTPGSSGVGTVSNGYSGLSWTNFQYLIGTSAGWLQGTMTGKVAYNNAGNPAAIAGTNAFDLNSAFLTAAYNDGLTVVVLGFASHTANYTSNYVYSNSFSLSSTTPTLVNFGCTGVKEVYFSASGGTPNVNYGGLSGTQFVMDNLLIATQAPAFTNQPQSQTAALGYPATFTAGVSGGTPMSFFWRKNGLNLTNSANVGGANSNVLSLVAVSAADAANYTLFVTNAYGSATSSVAGLNLAQPINITQQPQAVTICAGDGAAFSVGASWTNTLTYQWRTNGILIPNQTNTTLILNSVSANDPTNYDVVIKGGNISTNSQTASITVNLPPVVASLLPNTNETLHAGQPADFTVTISSVLPAACQWLANSVPIAGATNTDLSLTNLSDSNAGNYSVIASNQCGAVTNVIMTLAVDDTPFFYLQPASQTVGAGATVTFTAGVYGGTPMQFQWYFNGAKIGPLQVGTNLPPLILANVQTNQTGYYSVDAYNTASNLFSANAVLTVVTPPQLTMQSSSNTLQLNLYGTPGSNYVLQYNTSLSTTNWIPFSTINALPGSPVQFLFLLPPGATNRFYRALETY